MVGKITGIHHVALTVPDLDRALAFYRDLLGFEVVLQVAFPGEVNEADGALMDSLNMPMEKLTTQLKLVHGLPQETDVAGSVTMLKAGNIYFEIWTYDRPASLPQNPLSPTYQCGIMHFALDIVDLDELYPRLVQAGVKFNSKPQRSGEVNTAYGRDPFGNYIEFQEVLASATHTPRLPS
jgi:catechol 2,3-dioxygenase-like lactoylglutathione lyase family enzyme